MGYNKFMNLKYINSRTDLALELHEELIDKDKANEKFEIGGVKVSVTQGDVKTTVVEILSEEGASKMGKPIGKYVTLEWLDNNEIVQIGGETTDLERHLTREFHSIIGNIGNEAAKKILVVCLGNRAITPDALGPFTADYITVSDNLKVIAPGVLGTTGIETAQIVKAIASKINPDLIIAVDALASRSVSRLNKTVQISNTGIKPGAGMGNLREEITEETMGVPVIAVGVPTVVDAATIANESLEKMLKDLITYSDGSDFYKMIEALGEENRYPLIKSLLEPYENMFVTPKEIDVVMKNLSVIIASAINEINPFLE